MILLKKPLKPLIEINEAEVKDLVSNAISLDREIAYKQERLDGMKVRLKELAKLDFEHQTPTENDGWSWTGIDHDGNVARVTQPGPALKGKIDGEGETIEKVKTVSGKLFSRLFQPSISYKPVCGFREEVHQLLGGQTALKLLKLVSGSSAMKVAFETKEAK